MPLYESAFTPGESALTLGISHPMVKFDNESGKASRQADVAC